MTTKMLPRFWLSVEQFGPAAVTRVWQAALKDEFPLVQRFLRPQPELAACFPKIAPHRCPLPYEVVTHGPDDHEGVCPGTREVIPLTTHDITVYEVDKHKLFRSLATAFRITGSWEPVARQPELFRIGAQTSQSGIQVEVYVTFTGDAAELQAVATHLVSVHDAAFLLATPSRTAHRDDVKELLKRRGAALLPLSEAVEIDEAGQFVAGEIVEGTFAQVTASLARGVESPASINVFRKRGNMWQAAFAGKTAFLRHAEGLEYIAEALGRPGQPVDVMPLTAARSGDARALASGSRGTVLDKAALDAYQQKILDLQSEIAEAEMFHDLARHETLSEELDALINEVARAKGLGGRVREDSDRELLGKRVVNSIGRAIREIKKEHAQLAAHLRAYLRRGLHVCYDPPTPVRWVV